MDRSKMSKAFSNAKKGELFELKAELNSQSNSTRKEAVRKTIASMTIGRDVSGLFTDVLNCMQSPNIEIKKLVYLYIVNYAHTKPVRRISRDQRMHRGMLTPWSAF